MPNKETISPQIWKLAICIVLAVVTFAAYGQVSQFDFVNFDDDVYVTSNSHIKSGLSLQGFRWAFSTRYADIWNPLVWLSLMLDYELYGMNAGGYHITNLILHLLSTLLLFSLFNRMTGALWKSAFVAAFFALHPLHVESVAWVAERKDVLSAFFWMLTLCLYVYYVEKPDIKRYLLVLCGFVLALMSKPMVVTLPLIMILLDYWPLSRFRIGIESKKENLFLWQLKEKLPFFVLSSIIIILTLYNPNAPAFEMLDTPDLKPFSFTSRIVNAPVAFVAYLTKTFWPQNMAVFYPFTEQIPSLQVWGALFLILLVSITVIAAIKPFPYLFVGWLWFAITIAPVSGIIQVSYKAYAMADRYHYLPSIGIAMMLAWGVPLLFKSEPARKRILLPAAIFFLVILSVVTWRQSGYWKNNAELWSHALRVTKGNYLAYHNRGMAFRESGRYRQAFEDFNQAIKLKPYYAGAYNNRGIIFKKIGQPQRALEDYTRAIKLKPCYADVYNNRGNAYSVLGQYQYAIRDYDTAIRLKADYAEAYNNRAFVYFIVGNNFSGCNNARKSCNLGLCRILTWAKDRGLCH